MKRVLALLLISVATASVASGQAVDLPTRAKGAATVVVAKVREVHARYDTNQYGDRLIISQAWLEVEESLKGSSAPVLPVDIEGGTVGNMTLHVSDMPSLRSGERAVFFLDAGTTASGARRPHRRGLGVLKLDSADRVIGSDVALNAVRTAVRASQREKSGD